MQLGGQRCDRIEVINAHQLIRTFCNGRWEHKLHANARYCDQRNGKNLNSQSTWRFTLTMNLIEKVRFVYYKNVTVRSEGRVVKRFHSELTRMERGHSVHNSNTTHWCKPQTLHSMHTMHRSIMCTLCIVSIACILCIVSIVCTLCIVSIVCILCIEA